MSACKFELLCKLIDEQFNTHFTSNASIVKFILPMCTAASGKSTLCAKFK